ncbi:MAG: amidohydrolase [Acidobacteriaceae bacterium]
MSRSLLPLIPNKSQLLRRLPGATRWMEPPIRRYRRGTLGLFLGLGLCCLGMAGSTNSPPSSAVAIYFDGNIFTGAGLPNDIGQRATAIAIGEHQILAVGSDADVLRRKGAATKLFDLKGAFVMPGINDAHVHLADAGQNRLSVDLTGCTSLAEMLRRVKSAADRAEPGQWLLGDGWDHTLWPGEKLPTRQDLDAVTQGHPALFLRVDRHIAVADSAALGKAGITKSTHNPPGSQFDRDSQGELTGIVRESPAVNLIQQKIPPPSPELRRRALLIALNEAAANGVTSVQDNSAWEDFLVYQQLEREGQLPVRITEWLRFDDSLPALIAHRAAQPRDDRRLRTGMLKGFMDGSLGSRTAALLLPYSDDPGNSGLPRYDQNKLDAMTKERSAAGFQIGFHAIGDRAVDMALNAFTGTSAEARNRIEHSQVVEPKDIPRYKEFGVIASMQPSHLLTDMNWAEARLGTKRARTAYAWKAFLDAGVPLAFGTDYPVEPISPFRGIYAGVTRTNEAGTRSYFPEDKLSLGQVLYAYTQGSAYAEFSEGFKGKLVPGEVADFIVLDRDITRIAPPEILKVSVLKTVVDGRVVYEAHSKGQSGARPDVTLQR